MSQQTTVRALPFVVAAVLSMAACGSSDSSGSDDGAAVDAAAESDAAAAAPDFELFSSDEGSGCSVFVSVPEDAVTDTTDVRSMIWTGVVTTDAAECGFSDVVEVGLITVNGLDSYNQPDFAQTVEHGFFEVQGWDTLVEQCSALPIDGECSALLQSSFTE